MASIPDKISNIADDIGYKIGAMSADESTMKGDLRGYKIGFEIVGTFAVVLLLFIVIVIIAQLTSKLNNAYMFGNRSQKMCGQNYMEIESARNKLYLEYTSPDTEKKIKNIKKLLSASLILIVSILIVSICISAFGRINWEDWGWWWVYFGFAGVLLIAFLIAFFVVNRKAVLENTYGDSKTEKKMTPLLIVMLVLIVIVCIVNSIFINPEIKDETNTLVVLMIAAIFTIAFMFVVNINTKKINDNFISQYSNYSQEINGAICKLGKNDKDSISGGVNDGMKINKWIKQMLSRNYKRVNQDEEGGGTDYGFGENINCTDKNIYSYIEHSNSTELYELPANIDRVREQQNIIRKNMWNMRYENNAMIKPVKKIIQQMRIFILILMFILAFIVYHVAYVNYPGYTKMTLVAIVLIFTFILMYSIII